MVEWVNDDGLLVRFGLDQAKIAREGKVSVKGEEAELVVTIVGTEVPATASQLLYKQAGLPQGAHLVSATFYTDVIFTSGGAATLDIGLWSDDGDGTYTVNDANGIDAAVAITAIDALGEVVACDGALVGTVVPTVTGGRPLVVSVGYGTAAYTAGQGRLVIKYIV